MSTTPIVQFGTSRFLQAHVDLFVSEAMQQGEALGPIAVVQTSGDPSRSGRLRALADAAGYEVRIRGLRNSVLIDETVKVKSITQAYSLPQDLDAVSGIIATDAKIIVSNTSDVGFLSNAEDGNLAFSAQMSYPAKLTWFLFRRFQAGGKPIQIMPAELIANNGDVLRDLVLGIADIYPTDFQIWLRKAVLWVNSLVDRIVSEPLDPAGAIAEPYALWAIEDRPGLVLPCVHPDVRLVSDVMEAETLKLYILNLGHTYLVSRWLETSRETWPFVRDFLGDAANLQDLKDLYLREIMPAFEARGRKEEAASYVAATLDRFRNPFLDHKLSDIAQNHVEKVSRRIGAFITFARQADATLKMPRLEALVSKSRTMEKNEA